jgi:hypothetical protein
MDLNVRHFDILKSIMDLSIKQIFLGSGPGGDGNTVRRQTGGNSLNDL